MISLVDIPPREEPVEPVSPYAESEQKIESSLRNLIDQIRMEQQQEFNQRLYAAMNIWFTIGSIHPDENKKNTYMLMSKSIALLIDRNQLNDEQRERCEISVNYEPLEPSDSNEEQE